MLQPYWHFTIYMESLLPSPLFVLQSALAELSSTAIK